MVLSSAGCKSHFIPCYVLKLSIGIKNFRLLGHYNMKKACNERREHNSASSSLHDLIHCI